MTIPIPGRRTFDEIVRSSDEASRNYLIVTAVIVVVSIFAASVITASRSRVYADKPVIRARALDGGVCMAMRDAIDDYCADAPQFDDMTMLCVTYRGHKKPIDMVG